MVAVASSHPTLTTPIFCRLEIKVLRNQDIFVFTNQKPCLVPQRQRRAAAWYTLLLSVSLSTMLAVVLQGENPLQVTKQKVVPIREREMKDQQL